MLAEADDEPGRRARCPQDGGGAGGGAMLKLLIDTCVWIDLAKDHHQHPFLRSLDALMQEGKLAVMLPPLVLEEFERNKVHIVNTNRSSLSSALKRAKDLLDQHG